jgi:hypothetical protein
MSVRLLKELTMPTGRFAYWLEPDDRIKTPFENVPPLGSVPFQTGPPIESATVVPFVSLNLYR